MDRLFVLADIMHRKELRALCVLLSYGGTFLEEWPIDEIGHQALRDANATLFPAALRAHDRGVVAKYPDFVHPLRGLLRAQFEEASAG